jgi:hypothetical protein
MRRWTGPFVLLLAVAVSLTVIAAPVAAPPQSPPKEGERRPKLSLRANPLVAAAPARIVLTAELVGGADDFEEYYCASTLWQWGDDTASESNVDCPPYEAGKSQIRRRFTVEHVFRRAGNYRVMFHLKQRSRQVATAMTTLQIRPGVREF